MKYTIRGMTPQDAAIVSEWHYPDPYSFYDMTADPEDCEEFLDFPNWKPDSKFSVFDDDGLVGFFEFVDSEGIMDIGLGLRPDATGKGRGLGFLEAGLAFATKAWSPRRFRLAVATFNERAIKVYERAGFRSAKTFTNSTNGGVYEFLEMTKEV